MHNSLVEFTAIGVNVLKVTSIFMEDKRVPSVGGLVSLNACCLWVQVREGSALLM